MVWYAHTKTQTKPLADERERAIGFRIGTTATPSLSKGQAMDLHTMEWIVGLSLALQRHHGDQLCNLWGHRTLVHNGPHPWRSLHISQSNLHISVPHPNHCELIGKSQKKKIG